jgi:hypothetical protein
MIAGMKKSELLRALQTEIRRHSFDTFVENPPSVAQGGKGVVVPGCPTCRKRIHTMAKFVDHLADDVLPSLLDRLSGASDNKGSVAAHPADQSDADSDSV